MYNVRVSAEFSSTPIHDPLYSSSPTRREGDLSEIHVADIYRRKLTVILRIVLHAIDMILVLFLSIH
jgi:hypothetical protein